MRNLNLRSTAAMSLLLSIMCISPAQAAGSLTFVSFGGSWQAAQQKNMVEPYSKETGTQILTQNYTGGTAQIRTQVESNNVLWDVVDFENLDIVRACDDGLLERIPRNMIPKGADGTPAEEDFVKGTFDNEPCGVNEVIWSIVYAYNKKTIGTAAPTTIKDFFDLKKFPGKRALRKKAQINLEWALLADGVAPDEVYKVLATKAGQDRAFKKLDSIKKDVVWFDSWSQVPALLNGGSVVMAQAANGRISDSIKHDRSPFAIVWSGNVYDLEALGVVRGSKNKEEAIKFVLYATGTKPLAAMMDAIAYGSVRKSSDAFVAPEILTQMPSQHVKEGLQADAHFWTDFDASLNERFNQWLLE